MHKRKEGPAKGMKEQMDTFSPNETWAWFLLFFCNETNYLFQMVDVHCATTM